MSSMISASRSPSTLRMPERSGRNRLMSSSDVMVIFLEGRKSAPLQLFAAVLAPAEACAPIVDHTKTLPHRERFLVERGHRYARLKLPLQGHSSIVESVKLYSAESRSSISFACVQNGHCCLVSNRIC